MLGVHRINSSSFCVGMLRGVDNRVLDPELLDTINDDACPDFTKSFDEGKGTYIVDGDILKDFGKGA